MIKRFFATKDAQITNAHRESLFTTASLANMGLADVGEIFSLYNITGFNTQSSQNDISRLLYYFDISSILSDTEIPTSTAQFKFKLYNTPHDRTLPLNFTIIVNPVTASWDEGNGLDIENYLDSGAVNWLSRTAGTTWTTPGGDFDSTREYTQTFLNGYEDLEIDLTNLISLYRSGTLSNNGFILRLTGSQEISTQSYYTKRFFMRGTEFFFSRPCLEVQWDNSIQDDRKNSYMSSVLAASDDNLNTIYFYNRIKGRLLDIPSIGTGSIYVSFNTSSSTGTNTSTAFATGTWVATGTYKALFSSSFTGTLTDVWHNNAGTIFYTSSIEMKSFLDDYYDDNDEFFISMPNLRPVYFTNDKPRLDLFVRKKNWKANIYNVVTEEQKNEFIKKSYYSISRVYDQKNIINYGTGSIAYTKLSYDKDGNYFNLDMNLFEPNYQYEISYIFDIDNRKSLQKNKFRFKVEEQ